MARGRHSSGVLILLVLVAAVSFGEILWRATEKLGGPFSHSPSFLVGKTSNHGPLNGGDIGQKPKVSGANRDRSRVTLYQQVDNKVRNIFDLTQGLVIDTSVTGGDGGLALPTTPNDGEAEETGVDRKVRSAIGSIARDQENLRMGTKLRTGKTVFAAVTALMLAITASATATIPLWHQVLLPAVTSGLFVQTSVSESKGTEAKGLARHNSAQSVVLASQQEALLAQAEFRKAFLPFGVGLTAIFAAACVSLKIFNEKIGDLVPEDKVNPPLMAADNFLMVFFAVAAVLGAMRTSEVYLNMNSALTFKEEDKDSDSSKSKEGFQLPTEAREPTERERLYVNIAAGLLCLLPLPFFFRSFDFAALAGEGAFSKEFQEFIDSASVVMSATAGAQAAIVFLVAELQFADIERRIAVQGKQAALSELFFAQTQAEFAAMPAKSAWSGMMLAVASVAVEFSAVASGVSPWPAMLSSVKSFVSAKLTNSSADAAWFERQIQKSNSAKSSDQDALASTGRELTRLFNNVTSPDEFTKSVRESLVALPIGGTVMFDALNKESRRKVHLMAAELGMTSQSIPEKRAVAVTNFGGAKIDEQNPFAPASLAETAQGVFSEAQTTAINIAQRGIPAGEGQTIIPALAATAAGVAAPFVLGETGADFAVPLLTGGVGLVTVWQEQSGKGTVALAKEKVAKTKQRISKAESLLGRGTLASSAMPTYLAAATAATTASVIFFMEGTPTSLWWVNLALLGVTVGATMLAARRQKRVAFYIKQASRGVEGTPPPRSWVGSRRWWLVPLAIAAAVPCDLPRRCTIAMAVLATEVAMMMSSTFTQSAAASFYTARANRVYARGQTWASQASSESRALPKNSAAAISTTLLSLVLTSFDTSLGGIFPLIGMGVCLQAVQSRFLAGQNAKLAEVEVSDIQRIGTDAPPFLQRAAQTERLDKRYKPSVKPVQYTSADVGLLDDVLPSMSADLQRGGKSVDQLFEELSQGNEEISWPTFRDFFSKFNNGSLSSNQIERIWLVFDKDMGGGVSRDELQTILGKPGKGRRLQYFRSASGTLAKGALSMLDQNSADQYYSASAAEQAVEGVQNSLSELRLSIKSTEKNWLQTGAVVGTAATAAILAPFLLSELLTEVLLPVVGATLVLFAVDAEADSRSKIANAKVWAAELTEIASTQEELLALGGLYKARLISIAALSVCVAITTIVLEEPFGIFEAFPQWMVIQNIIRWGLIITQAVCALWSTRRYLTVLEWTDRVNSRVSVTTSRNTFEETPKSWFQGRRENGKLDRRFPSIVAVLPVLLLTIFPLGRHFGKRAVASTASGAAIAALALYAAERAFARAELSQSARMRTSALAEAFCEQAEQQGALLPFISAGTIAVAGVITFATELNPIFAAGLTVLQALGWVVASRKGAAAKFESDAALKVNLNTTTPRINADKDPIKRIKRWLMS